MLGISVFRLRMRMQLRLAERRAAQCQGHPRIRRTCRSLAVLEAGHPLDAIRWHRVSTRHGTRGRGGL
jgi:hypothetical protein